MANRIKGITIEIDGDVTGLNKALEGTNKKIRNTQAQLRDVDKLLKLDPKNTDLLAQKQRLLAEQIGNTKEKLAKLKQAEQQAQQQFKEGKISQEQYEALRREIIATENSLGNLETQASETEKDLENAAKGGTKGFKDTERAIHGVGNEANKLQDNSSSLGDIFKGAVAATGILAVASALKEVCENTKEYRNDLAKLTTAFTTNGQTAEVAKKTYDELYAILGDSGQAVEASNHLALLAKNEADLAKWTDIAAGVYGTFGNSLPIEGLTEAANETAKTGQLTGNLADALNWAGIQEDDFQAKLDACTNETDRAALITNTLAGAYNDAGQAFRETNKDVIDANRASGKLQDALARLGKKVEPIITELVKASTKLLDVMIDATPVVTGLVAAFSAYKIAKFASALDLATIKQKAFNVAANANPYVLLATLIATAITLSFELVNILKEQANATDQLTKSQKKAADSAKRLNEDAYRAARNVGKEVANASQLAAAETESAVNAISGQVEALTEKYKEAKENRINSMTEDASYFEHIEKLKNELVDLADANGNVNESDRARVQFILSQLSEATGEEYSMIDGLIENYNELKSSIDSVIATKRVNALLESYNPEYQQALQSEATLAEDVGAKYNDAMAKKQAYQDLDKFYADKVAQGLELDPNDYVELENAKIAAQEAETAYYDAVLAYGEVEETIVKYETAMGEALAGNYEDAEKVLTDTKGLLSEEEQAYMDVLRGQIDFTKTWLDETKEAMQTGGAGSAEKYQLAMKDYFAASEERTGAVQEALGFGEDVAEGMAYGIDNKKGFVYDKVRDLVNGIIKTAREEADSHSPSVKMEDFGADLAAGVPLGIDKKMAELRASGSRLFDQVAAGMTYSMDNAGQASNVSYDNRSSSIGNISVYVSGANVEDPGELADMIAERLNNQILDRKAVLS